MIHFWCHYGERDDETKRRLAVAHATWAQFSDNIELTNLRRAKQPEWFARDIITAGLSIVADPTTPVLFTNADVGFLPDADHLIFEAVKRAGACHLRKRNFQVIPFNEITDGGDYPGMDAFAFTPRWWATHGCFYPDMIFGRQHWDSCLRNLIRKTGGVEVRNVMWHEEHPSLWQAKEAAASNLYNERLLCEWIGRHGGSTQDHNYTIEELNYR